MNASDETKARRLPLIKMRAIARRKSVAMREVWERRRAELNEFIEDDHTESTGNADAELLEYDRHDLREPYMVDRELTRRAARIVWLAGVRHGDAQAHRTPDNPSANEGDIAYWRAAELAFDRWWLRTSTRRQGRRTR